MDISLLAILLVAIAAGFFLGRRSTRLQMQSPAHKTLTHPRYLEGLKHLVNEQPDAAIDALVTELEVNRDSAEMYFSLGALWRKKGEMDRAIRVHEALLSNTGLTPEQVQQAQLELALDYTHSGLLDRGEVLLKELAGGALPAIQQAAGRELVLLYQEEQEWEKAIAAVDSFCSKTAPQDQPYWRHLQAHYCCELAERALAAPDWSESVSAVVATPEAAAIAYRWLQQAEHKAPGHPRVLLLRALLALGEHNEDAARGVLQSISLVPGLNMVVVPLILNTGGYARDDIWRNLSRLYQESRDTGLLPFLAECVYRREGAGAALGFLVEELRGQEGQESLAQLLNVAVAQSLHYEPLRPVLHQVLPFRFTCHQCGFHGRQFHWSCPSCKTWL